MHITSTHALLVSISFVNEALLASSFPLWWYQQYGGQYHVCIIGQWSIQPCCLRLLPAEKKREKRMCVRALNTINPNCPKEQTMCSCRKMKTTTKVSREWRRSIFLTRMKARPAILELMPEEASELELLKKLLLPEVKAISCYNFLSRFISSQEG